MRIHSLSLVLALSFLGVANAAAQDRAISAAGAAEYRVSCATCHGEGGGGDGPVAAQLKVKPADLTQLAKRNRGAFPFLKVFETIDGRVRVMAHGTREMPVWGDRYQAELQQKYKSGGEIVSKARIETVIRARILELIYYLQTIQQK